MVSLNELLDAVETGQNFLSRQKEIKEFEIFASANQLNVLRVAFATNVPNNALEDAKSMESFGLSVNVLLKNGLVGFGKSDADLSLAGIKNAFEKAKKNMVSDEDFKSFPSPKKGAKKRPVFDKKIMVLDEGRAIQSAYDCLDGALSVLEKKKVNSNLNITGEVNFLAEKMAIKNSNGVSAFDQTTVALSTLTTILEKNPDISGMWFDSATELKKLDTKKTGSVSAQKALSSLEPKKINSGEFDVVFGRVAVAELLYSRFDVGLNAIDLKASPYVDRLNETVAVPELSIVDDGTLEGAIGTKAFTDEGLPTGKTQIIKNGKLVNFLSNDYYSKKFGEKDFEPLNGFRGGGPGRHHSSSPSVIPTNIVVGKGKFSDEELIKEVKNGVFIGRLWYTYPVNGLSSADFTSTARGDSFLIENGEIKSSLVPNTVRINDNLDRIFKSIIGIGKKQQATLAWGQDAVVVTPEIAVKNVRLERIAKDIY